MAREIIRTVLDLPAGLRRAMDQHVAQTGETLRAFLIRAVEARIEQDNKSRQEEAKP